ncbi:MAG: hypothetical protein VYC34_10725, partial [Planctomycetota bacterium]|nr:hypothetical protein [Planctomycetota bacterium]
MIRLRQYDHEFPAERAAAYLRAHGVNAQLVNTHINASLGVPGLRFAQVHLVIGSREERPEAERLLEEYDRLQREGSEAGWEAAAPDLSRLDAERYPVECPHCDAALRLDADLRQCPMCGEAVDVVELLV